MTCVYLYLGKLMNKLKVLHVASFTGNIGDNANHTGFRANLEKHIKSEVEYTDFEIREVFWKHKAFDQSFVKLANQHDLIIIGGGNYFELWVENSETGTSIDISLELLNEINNPIVFNALGVDPAQGAKEESLYKFRKFLDYAIESPSILLSCRNDGSYKTLTELVGIKYAQAFHHIPDSGFFTTVKDTYHPELELDKKNIVIQIAGDMLDTRFPKRNESDNSFSDFVDGMAKYIEMINNEQVNFVLVPHIFRDLSVIHSILDKLPDNIRRANVSVAPYLVGQKGQDYIFDIYKKADLVLGMRFHASVCGLGLGTPCIGLVNYRQIDELYNELGLKSAKVDVRLNGFHELLFKLSKKVLGGEIQYKDNLLLEWKNKLDNFHNEISKLV